MKYKSSEVLPNEIVYCDIVLEKEINKGKRKIISEEIIKKAVYREINNTYKNRKVLDVKVRARLGYSFNRHENSN